MMISRHVKFTVIFMFALLNTLFFASPSAAQGIEKNAHHFTFISLKDDMPIPLENYRGKAVLVVNTASQCGFTDQYEGLQSLYETYHDRGLEIIAVPSNDFGGQEPGSHEQIADFTAETYGITFPLTHKYSVKGDSAHPFYQWAAAQGKGGLLFSAPRWNFHKYLIASDGSLAASFSSMTKPDSEKIKTAIEDALGGS